VIGPTPLLDFFKRGEVERDARMAAAQGTLAPRAHEQLAILVLLLDDPDGEIRQTAGDTVSRIPEAALKAFLGRSDVPVGLREFFAGRGVVPDERPNIQAEVDVDSPLLDAGRASESEPAIDEEHDEPETRETAQQRLQKMSFTERLRAAVKGTREMRAILIRDTNKMIAAAVLSSPKLAEPEVEAFAKMANVSDDVLRTISQNRAWMKNYNIALSLAKNPKTPVGTSLHIMPRLNDRDLAQLSVDRNVPEPLRIAARKKVVAKQSGKDRG
jgi:hypothetical protein